MQSDSVRLIETIKNTIKKHSLIDEGDKILVGVSGGADSVCLLHCLKQIAPELKFSLCVVHVNHGIRGDEAQRDMEFVKELCIDLGIDFFVEEVDVPELAKKENLSVEAAGRLARYRAFHRICIEKGYNKVATAHNRDDQAETVLMRIIRGTGIDGLSGIKYKRDDGVIRPILDIERRDIEKYLSEYGIEYCTDSTNGDNNYTRNKIRNILLPMLRDEFNPNINSALSHLAETSSQDSNFINGYAKRLYSRINGPIKERKPVVLDIESLNMLEESIKIRVIKNALADVMGKYYKTEKSHIDFIISLLNKETGSKVELPGDLNVVVRYGWLAFEKKDKAVREEFYSNNSCYEVEIGNVYDVAGYRISIGLTDVDAKTASNQIILDYDKLKDMELCIRCRRKGDKIAVFSDGRTKKLKSLMIDLKIPRNKRDEIPLLCCGEEVVAVIGYRCAEKYKINNNTKSGLVVTYDGKNEDW